MTRFCTKCGAENDDSSQYCGSCQMPLSPVSGGYQPMQSVNQYTPGPMTDWKAMGADKKIGAGIVGILLGSLGIHKFILGYTTEGIIMLAATIVISVVSCGILWPVMWLIGLVEGIIYLTKSDEEFVRTYIQTKRGWF
jgi:TM2 domain-containing membrane protein YozV